MKKLQKPIRNADVHILKNIDDEEKMQVQLGVSERETGTLGSASKFLEYLFNKPIIYTPNAIMWYDSHLYANYARASRGLYSLWEAAATGKKPVLPLSLSKLQLYCSH